MIQFSLPFGLPFQGDYGGDADYPSGQQAVR
jgi:hypothetical protein